MRTQGGDGQEGRHGGQDLMESVEEGPGDGTNLHLGDLVARDKDPPSRTQSSVRPRGADGCAQRFKVGGELFWVLSSPSRQAPGHSWRPG